MFKKFLMSFFRKCVCSVLLMSMHNSFGLEQPRSPHGLNPRPTLAVQIPLAKLQADVEQAVWVIQGVIKMYQQDVQLPTLRYNVQTREVIPTLNASYTHATRTFKLPYVLRGKQLYSTACDQGIVSHEAGHMILKYLRTLFNTSHTGAFHEAFGDLTAHFFRFYNQETRHEFLEKMTYEKGCVGDTHFSCTRNNSEPLRLRQVAEDADLCEVHDLSTPFSSAVYENMESAYQNRGVLSQLFTWGESTAASVVSWHREMLVKAVLSINLQAPTLMDLANQMLHVSRKNPLYRDGLGRNFIKNGLIVILYSSPSTYYYSPNGEYARLCLPNSRGRTLRLTNPRPYR